MRLLNLGIIAGNGSLPNELASIYSQAGGSCYVAVIKQSDSFGIDTKPSYNPNVNVISVRSDYITEKENVASSTNQIQYNNFSLGEVGGLIDYFRQHNVQNIVFIGGVKRPEFKDIKTDLVGKMLLAKIIAQKLINTNKVFGDDTLLRTIASFFEEKGFKVMSAHDILSLSPNYYANIFAATINCPSEQEIKDIGIGANLLQKLGEYDIGQSIVVHNNYVLGIEAAEGTDNLIKRCSTLRQSTHGGVLIKMAKTTQDLRLDIPVIGPGTIDLLMQNHYSGLAIGSKILVADSQQVLQKITKSKRIFISVIN